MSNIFGLLSAGTKYNKAKNNEAIKIFKGNKDSKPSNDLSDIFGKSTNNNSSKSHQQLNNGNVDNIKKRNINEEDSDDEDSDSDVNSSNSNLDNEDCMNYNFDKEDEMNCFRNRMQIKVKGQDIPKPCATFVSMDMFKDLKHIILKNIESSLWKEPTPIQMQAIPSLLQGRDVLATAPTGSGKTAAFVIPTLSRLKQPQNGTGIRALFLIPTKELAEQITRETQRLSIGRKFNICLLDKKISSRAIAQHDKAWCNKYDVLVATPLRLLSLVREKVVDLSKIEIIVLDEADKLFELDQSSHKSNHKDDANDNSDDEEASNYGRVRSSFLNQVDEILAECPTENRIQRALFSATVSPFVSELADSFLVNPLRIAIGKENTGANTITQSLVFVGREEGKLLAIRQIIQKGLKPPVLLFIQSIDRAKELFRELVYDGINVDIMHAEKTSAQRQETIQRFRLGEIWVLICTDLMSRGIDFKGVQMVINFDLPLSAVSYIHRIGRTGRGGKKGEAITFFTEKDMPNIRAIANVIKLSGGIIPEWMLAIKPLSTKDKKRLRNSAPKRRHIDHKIKN